MTSLKQTSYFLTLYFLFSLPSFSSSNLIPENVEVKVKANSQHEECFYVEEKNKLSYSFTSQKGLDFNLHYHDETGMNFLKDRENTVNEKAKKIELTSELVYCLMWQNKTDASIALRYQFSME